jgi:hypothetical protein
MGVGNHSFSAYRCGVQGEIRQEWQTLFIDVHKNRFIDTI